VKRSCLFNSKVKNFLFWSYYSFISFFVCTVCLLIERNNKKNCVAYPLVNCLRSKHHPKVEQKIDFTAKRLYSRDFKNFMNLSYSTPPEREKEKKLSLKEIPEISDSKLQTGGIFSFFKLKITFFYFYDLKHEPKKV
jgi:hypothetical protein